MYNFDIIDKISNEDLQKIIKLALNPPLESVNLGDAFVKMHSLPPQPSIEYISTETLDKRISGHFEAREITDLFLAIDQIISLLPYEVYENLEQDRNTKLFHIWKEKIIKNIKQIERLTMQDIRSEDTKKKRIFMIAPSNAQFSMIKNKWDEVVWKKKAYDGSDTPDYFKWAEEVDNIATALSKEGIESDVAVDKLILNELTDKLNNNRLIGLTIPPGLAKIGYSRDQSLTFYPYPIIGNMSLSIRQGEEEVINDFYYKIGIPPMARVRWSSNDNILVKAKLEGGNVFIIKSDDGVVLLTGIGVRGSNYAAIRSLAKLLPGEVRVIGVPLNGYINNWLTGSVHLDVAFSYLGQTEEGLAALVDPTRIGFYSCLEYDRKTDFFKIIEFPKLMNDLKIRIIEPPRENQSPITMVNTLNLGNGKIISDVYNKDVNAFIEKNFGIEVIEVNIPQIEAGGGGVRCSTKELWK